MTGIFAPVYSVSKRTGSDGMVAGRLAVGSGRCGRVLDVGAATLTSATGG
jgi:hypothetical protein